MKKNWLFLGLILLALGACQVKVEPNTTEPTASSEPSSQNTETGSSSSKDVAATDAAVQAIEQEKLRKERRVFTAPDDPTYSLGFDGYYRGNELVKFTTSGGESGLEGTTTYYLQDGQVFFINEQRSYFDNPTKTGRYYLKEGKIYAALVRENPEEMDDTQKLSSFPEKDLSQDPSFNPKNVIAGFDYSFESYKKAKVEK